MRNSALVLGIIGGVWAMFVGFIGYGWTELAASEAGNSWIDPVRNPEAIRAAAFLAPLLAIAGAAMARSRNQLAAGLMGVSALVMYLGFGFHFYTMFPIAFCALGAVLALAATAPDPH